MKKIFIAVLGALFLAVFILHSTGAIQFGVGHLIARLWALIPLLIGYYFLQSNDKRKNKSGLMLTIMGGFLLVLNITILFFESQEYIFAITLTGLLTFWPIIILVLVISVIFSLFERGETVYRSRFAVKTVEDVDLKIPDCTVIAQFGKLVFKVKPDDLSIRALRLDVIAFAGVVEIIVPEEVSILAESKTRLGYFNILGRKSKKIIGQEVVEAGKDASEAPRLLLVTNSWFGKVVIKKS